MMLCNHTLFQIPKIRAAENRHVTGFTNFKSMAFKTTTFIKNFVKIDQLV